MARVHQAQQHCRKVLKFTSKPETRMTDQLLHLFGTLSHPTYLAAVERLVPASPLNRGDARFAVSRPVCCARSTSITAPTNTPLRLPSSSSSKGRDSNAAAKAVPEAFTCKEGAKRGGSTAPITVGGVNCNRNVSKLHYPTQAPELKLIQGKRLQRCSECSARGIHLQQSEHMSTCPSMAVRLSGSRDIQHAHMCTVRRVVVAVGVGGTHRAIAGAFTHTSFCVCCGSVFTLRAHLKQGSHNPTLTHEMRVLYTYILGPRPNDRHIFSQAASLAIDERCTNLFPQS